VIIIHLFVLWFVSAHLRWASPRYINHPLQVMMLSPNLGPREAPAPPLDWDFKYPEAVIVPPPEITIDPDVAGQIVGTPIIQKLPPRIDPSHVNERPELPSRMGFVSALSLALRLHILPDGSVADAQILRSTGDAGIDRLAVETVKGQWHYLPASVNGKPIESWMTVIVRFSAI
jgi:TonB family protein